MSETCAIDDDECLGDVNEVEFCPSAIILCKFHERILGELGERAFCEWYSNELDPPQSSITR